MMRGARSASIHERLEQMAHVAGSLRKPYDLNELTRAVRSVLGEDPSP